MWGKAALRGYSTRIQVRIVLVVKGDKLLKLNFHRHREKIENDRLVPRTSEWLW